MDMLVIFILATNFSNHVPYFFAGVLGLSLEMYCCRDVLLVDFIVLRAFARICLAWNRFSCVGCLLNFLKADFLLFITFLTSLLNQCYFFLNVSRT